MAVIRPATADDVQAVAELTEAAYEAHVPTVGRRPAPMDADHGADVAAGRVSVLDEGGEVVGAIVLVPAGDHLLVESVAVAPSRQGRGYGGELMRFAEQRAREQGLVEIRLYTHQRMTANVAMYPRLGYQETGRRTEHGFPRVFFRKRV